MHTLRIFFFLSSLIFPLLGQAHTTGCTFTVQDLDFGTYVSNQSSDLDSTAQISISNCPHIGDYNITLSAGTSGDTNNRTLKSGSASLNYNLYQDAARSKKWGDNFNNDLKGRALSCGHGPIACQHTVYGRIPGNQNIPSGTYSDNIIVTLEY